MNSTSEVWIRGIGTAVPPHVIEQAKTAELAASLNCQNPKHLRLLPVLYQKTRVGRRASVFSEEQSNGYASFGSFFEPLRSADDRGPGTEKRMRYYAEKAPLLAVDSALKALADAGVGPEEIKNLVTVSCTGFSAPGFDVSLIKRLGLSPEVTRTHVGFMGCHGAFNGLRVASAYSLEKPEEMTLVCSVELSSIHFAYGWNPDQVVANALFADGSSAVVVSGSAGSKSGASKAKTHWKVLASGSRIFPDSEGAMKWEVGDHGFEMQLSAKVPGLIEANLKPWLEKWLGSHGLSLKDIRSWAIHPGGPRVLDSVEKSLELPENATAYSKEVLKNFGNMSSATILFIIERMMQADAPTPCVALGFGPGLTVEAMLLG